MFANLFSLEAHTHCDFPWKGPLASSLTTADDGDGAADQLPKEGIPSNRTPSVSHFAPSLSAYLLSYSYQRSPSLNCQKKLMMIARMMTVVVVQCVCVNALYTIHAKNKTVWQKQRGTTKVQCSLAVSIERNILMIVVVWISLVPSFTHSNTLFLLSLPLLPLCCRRLSAKICLPAAAEKREWMTLDCKSERCRLIRISDDVTKLSYWRYCNHRGGLQTHQQTDRQTDRLPIKKKRAERKSASGESAESTHLSEITQRSGGQTRVNRLLQTTCDGTFQLF